MDAERLKVLGARAQELGKLKEHESWSALRTEFDRKKDKHTRRLVKLVMARETAAITQREIDYVSGFWAGAEWILDNPDCAEDALVAALKKASNLEEVKQLV